MDTRTSHCTPRKRRQATLTPEEITRNQIIEDYLPLVHSVVSSLKNRLVCQYTEKELFSIGVTGLMAAASRRDPTRNTSFASYARMRIKGAIVDELRKTDTLSRRFRVMSKKLNHAIGELEQELGRTPTDFEIARKLEVDLKTYRKLRRKTTPIEFVSIDRSIDNESTDTMSFHNIHADENVVPAYTGIENEETHELLRKKLETLPELQKKVLAFYYFEEMRLAEIAQIFNLTKSRISQILSEAKAVLRRQIEPALSQ